MFCFWPCLCIYIGLLDVVAAAVEEKLYQSPVDVIPSSNQNQTLKEKARSAIECAGKCSRNDFCLLFYFDKSSKACHMSSYMAFEATVKVYSSKHLKNSDQQTQGPTATTPTAATTTISTITEGTTTTPVVCPSAKGYAVYTENSTTFCLKIVETSVVPSDAENACSLDGGHLVSINNAQEHDFLKTILVGVNSLDVWIDGQDQDGDHVFQSWRGENITYLVWADKDPNETGASHLRLRSAFNYNHADNTESRPCGYVCQID